MTDDDESLLWDPADGPSPDPDADDREAEYWRWHGDDYEGPPPAVYLPRVVAIDPHPFL